MRGNYEIYVFFLLYFAIWIFPQRKSAVLIGMAAACKIFPAAFVFLFLDRKYWPRLILAGFTALLLTLISFALLTGTIASNFSAFNGVLKQYHGYYVLNPAGLSFNNSLYGALIVFSGGGSASLARGYFYLTAFAGAVIILLCALETVFWKKVAFVVVMMTLLPYVSSDYRLVHFFLPFFLFLDSPGGRSDRLYCWLFGLIFIPKVWFACGLRVTDCSSSVVLNPVVLCVLFLALASENPLVQKVIPNLLCKIQ